ncbi:YopJ family acetyltransferase [Pseudomonas entomophila]|uniref:YopJ family acetyltransferase n=1 Tax=Pseudomonas entomophila TaxID=312306 RepID=UPI001F02EE1F|nr:YopJ family acetyltransferase [Pseudomonas entomophila]MCG8291481.1 hypothetical protein [Pseudomonas entomophila]
MLKISAISLAQTNLSEPASAKLLSYQNKLNQCIAEVNQALHSDHWHTTRFDHHDVGLMPGLIEHANKSAPGLNLMLATSPSLAVNCIQDALMDGVSSGRIIVNIGTEGIHWSALDFRVMNGKCSIISFEPSTFLNHGPAKLDSDLSQQLTKGLHGREHNFHTIFMDIQRSASECGIFSLVTTKKLHKYHDEITVLHELNIEGDIQNHHKDTILPPAFMKHTQSKSRLAEYIDNHPEGDTTEINKKKQTLVDHQASHLATTHGKEMVTSIHEKRLDLYLKLQKFITP